MIVYVHPRETSKKVNRTTGYQRQYDFDKDNSWSFEAGLRTCQNNSSSIRYGGKGISFIRKNGHILRGGEHICRQRVYS